MTLQEMMKLQGMRPDSFFKVVSDMELGQQIGNAMSVNVVERILFQVFKVVRLKSKFKIDGKMAQQ